MDVDVDVKRVFLIVGFALGFLPRLRIHLALALLEFLVVIFELGDFSIVLGSGDLRQDLLLHGDDLRRAEVHRRRRRRLQTRPHDLFRLVV